MAAKRLTGTLVRINARGFAFIHVTDDGDYFAHCTEMTDRTAWEEGRIVSFIPAPSAKQGGSPAAKDIRPA